MCAARGRLLPTSHETGRFSAGEDAGIRLCLRSRHLGYRAETIQADLGRARTLQDSIRTRIFILRTADNILIPVRPRSSLQAAVMIVTGILPEQFDKSLTAGRDALDQERSCKQAVEDQQ